MLAEIKYQESQGRMESAQAIIGFPGTSAKISFMYLIGTPAGTEHYTLSVMNWDCLPAMR